MRFFERLNPNYALIQEIRLMTAATDRLATSTTNAVTAMQALGTALTTAKNENGDAAANAAADQLDAAVTAANAELNPPVVDPGA